MFSRTDSVWERDLLALRVMPTLDGKWLEAIQSRDAGWLVGRGARVGAIGIVLAEIASDGEELHVRAVKTGCMAPRGERSNEPCRTERRVDEETTLLQSIARRLDRLRSPLVVTCGGRSLDLPFLRYRALAQGVSLPGLHLSLAGKWAYFNRYDASWHFDISDSLAGQGASMALGLEELCTLRGLQGVSSNADPRTQASREAALVFLVFLGILCTMGRLSLQEYNAAESALDAS